MSAILHELETHRNYRRSALGDAESFEFTNLRADHVTILRSRLGLALADPRRVSLTFADLRRFFCLITMGVATTTWRSRPDRTVFAGVLGTYPEHDPERCR